MIKLTNIYKRILDNYKDVDVAVDMTCGNGHDTLYLSSIAKKVYSFDIQQKAIDSCKDLITNQLNITFICDNHQNILNYINEEINLAIYNLGYLPGGDKSIMTHADSTLSSLKSLLSLLAIDGLVVIEVYPHNQDESHAIKHYTSQLSHSYDVIKINLHNKKNSPYLILIKKHSY